MIIKFNKRMKELREDLKITQGELAKEMNVSRATISHWELGVQEPDYLMLAKLAQFYKVSTDYLLGLED